MTTPDQSKGDRSRDEVLAGEYVLGVLASEERRRVEARMRRDRPFATIVRRWEDNLSTFNDEYGEEAAPEALFLQIENRLHRTPPTMGNAWGRPSSLGALWNSLILWRAVALICLLGMFGYGVANSGLWRFPPSGRGLVAEMAGQGSNAVSLVAHYDGSSGRLQVTPVATGSADEKSLELWMIEGSNPARSLGVLPQSGEGEIVIPADMRRQLTEGVVMAVSLEPYGGSPTGKATGPVIAIGPALVE